MTSPQPTSQDGPGDGRAEKDRADVRHCPAHLSTPDAGRDDPPWERFAHRSNKPLRFGALEGWIAVCPASRKKTGCEFVATPRPTRPKRRPLP